MKDKNEVQRVSIEPIKLTNKKALHCASQLLIISAIGCIALIIFFGCAIVFAYLVT